MSRPERAFAVLPSNQPWWNRVIIWLGLKKTVNEQVIQVLTATEMVAEFQRQQYFAKMFYVPGETSGASGDNIPELKQMIAQGWSWLQTFPPTSRRAISNHSNSGTSPLIYIYPQLSLSADMAMGKAQAAILARRVGGTVRTPAVRSLLFMLTFRNLGAGRSILHETGQHQEAVNAEYLYKYARYHGIQIARTWLEWEGLPFDDGPVPSDVVVPAGEAFNKYRPGVVAPPVPPPPDIKLPLLKLTDPYSRDTRTGDFETAPGWGYNIRWWPVHWLQWTLNRHTSPVLPHLTVDGIYGPSTAANVKAFQAAHYWNGAHLVASGEMDEATWAKLRTV
jgi:peptidoglycan hydrolase-like protein with peptidoglycan-binding domain